MSNVVKLIVKRTVFCIVVTMKHFLSATLIYDSGKSSSSLLSMGPASR
jgi:hypothetical protein